MADFLVFRLTGMTDDGVPTIQGPISDVIRDLKADDADDAVARALEAAGEPARIGDRFIAFRWDQSVEVTVDGPPTFSRTRG